MKVTSQKFEINLSDFYFKKSIIKKNWIWYRPSQGFATSTWNVFDVV